MAALLEALMAVVLLVGIVLGLTVLFLLVRGPLR